MIQPQGNYITVTYSPDSLTSVLYCDDLDVTTITEPIVRQEFQHDKQRSALEYTGVKPIYVDMLGGEPNQIIYGNNATARNLLPDDNDLTNIFQKFFITRYVYTGIDSGNTDISNMQTIWQHFRSVRDKFEAHKSYAGAAVSIQYLLTNLQGDNFSYMTSTNLTVSGSSLGTQNSLFMNNFSAKLARDIYAPTPKKFWKWMAEFYSIQLQALETVTGS